MKKTLDILRWVCADCEAHAEPVYDKDWQQLACNHCGSIDIGPEFIGKDAEDTLEEVWQQNLYREFHDQGFIDDCYSLILSQLRGDSLDYFPEKWIDFLIQNCLAFSDEICKKEKYRKELAFHE